MSSDEILNTLHTLYGPDDVIEIRIIRKKGKSKSTDSGYYDYAHFDKCAEDISKIDGLPGIPAIYCTVNPVQKILLARSHNRLTQGADSTTNGEQIKYRKYLPFDIDPVRPAGTSSTDEMHDKSIEKAHEVKEWLSEKGFPVPIVGDSGNGAHLLYRIDEPNTPEAKELIENVQKAVVTALSHPDKDGIDIQGFADANRIWKVYGTITKKGDEIHDIGIRHRRSKLLEVPDDIKIVTTDILISVGELYEKYVDAVNLIQDKAEPQQTNKEKFDIKAWMDKYDIHVVRTKQERNKTIYVLETCPLNPDHTGNKEAVIIQESNGRLGFKCHHNSCDGKGWKDVRDKIEPKPKEKNTTKGNTTDNLNCGKNEGDIFLNIENDVNLRAWETDLGWDTEILKAGKTIGQTIWSKHPLWRQDDKRDRSIRTCLEVAEVGTTRTRTKILMELVSKIPDNIKYRKKVVIEKKTYTHINGINFETVLSTIHKHLHIIDEAPIVVTIATALTNKLPGDPVWTMTVAPPGAGKSEIIRALTPTGEPTKYVHPISTLTPNTFISGLPENEDLLPRLDGKIVTIKDFTTILTKQKDARNEILGQLREIYDGYFGRETGSGIGTKGYNSKITVIAGVTPVIDHYSGVQSLLGERFLRIRDQSHKDTDENQLGPSMYRDDIIGMAFSEEGKEKETRQDIANHLLSYYDEFKPEPLPFTQEAEQLIKYCANIVSVLRTGIKRDHNHNITAIPEPEYGTRIVKQFKKLASILANMFGKECVDLDIVSYIYRVALDTVDKKRIEIFKKVERIESATSRIANQTTLPTNTVKEILEDLWILGVVHRGKKDGAGEKSPYYWSFTKKNPVVNQIATVENMLSRIDTHNRLCVHYDIYKVCNESNESNDDIYNVSNLRIKTPEKNNNGDSPVFSQRDIVKIIRDTITDKQENGITPITKVLDYVLKQGISFDKCKSAIKQMKAEGSIFEPKDGFYKCV